MVIIFFPLCFGIILTTIAVHGKLSKEVLRVYYEYAACLQERRDQQQCPPKYREYRTVTAGIIDLLMFDIYSFVQVAYVLAPRAARQFWSDVWSNIKQICLKCAEKRREKSYSNQPEMKDFVQSD